MRIALCELKKNYVAKRSTAKASTLLTSGLNRSLGWLAEAKHCWSKLRMLTDISEATAAVAAKCSQREYDVVPAGRVIKENVSFVLLLLVLLRLLQSADQNSFCLLPHHP